MAANDVLNATKFSRPLLFVAFLILAGFSYIFYDMYKLADTKDSQLWDRRKMLYGSVEALAFTAAGYVFGKEVHREQAQRAEKRADAKTAEAEKANTEAADARAKGHSLKHAIRAKQQSFEGAPLWTCWRRSRRRDATVVTPQTIIAGAVRMLANLIALPARFNNRLLLEPSSVAGFLYPPAYFLCNLIVF